MNKKLLVALMLPLMLIPLTGFAYAHWTDSVTKQIKLHSGCVAVDIVKWHIDNCNSYDVDCDGVLYGDEIIVEMLTDADGQVIELYITADPVWPGWTLEFKFLIHNKGKLTVDSFEHHVFWVGPLDTEPPWETAETYPGGEYANTIDCIDYSEELYITTLANAASRDFLDYTIPVDPTTYTLQPSHCVLVKETITFGGQATPEVCAQKWFLLTKQMVFKQHVGEPWSSESWVKPAD